MIVVTAPTSSIGRRLVPLLLAADTAVRVIVRDPARLDPAVRDRVEIVEGSHRDRVDALEGSVFWLTPPDPTAADVRATYLDFTRPAAEAFASGKVDRVVGISALGRDTPAAAHAGHVTASLAMDDLIAGTGVAFRALTMPSFMDNLLEQADAIRGGVFYGTIDPDRKLPTCAVRDIAATAARLLLDGSWTGQAEVPVLGPEDLSHHEMAGIMTEVLGRPVRYQQIPDEAFLGTLTSGGMSGAMAQAMVDMARAKNEGLDNAAPRTPETSTPTTFRQWCAEDLKARL